MDGGLEAVLSEKFWARRNKTLSYYKEAKRMKKIEILGMG
jgi:hypothetical protein